MPLFLLGTSRSETRGARGSTTSGGSRAGSRRSCRQWPTAPIRRRWETEGDIVNCESNPGKLGSLSVSSYSPYSMRTIHYVPLGPPRKQLKVYFFLPYARPVPVQRWSSTSWFGQWSPDHCREHLRDREESLGKTGKSLCLTTVRL